MDGQTDRGTDMTKLIVASRSSANAPEKSCILVWHLLSMKKCPLQAYRLWSIDFSKFYRKYKRTYIIIIIIITIIIIPRGLRYSGMLRRVACQPHIYDEQQPG
jgi:hypothetical protein